MYIGFKAQGSMENLMERKNTASEMETGCKSKFLSEMFTSTMVLGSLHVYGRAPYATSKPCCSSSRPLQ